MYLAMIQTDLAVSIYYFNYISTLYSHSEICVLNNGLSTGWFCTQRGVRQGCPIAPMLFILAVEKLAIRIRESPDISGIVRGTTESCIIQYADDTVLTLENEASAIAAFQILDDFRTHTSLQINIAKTQALPLGTMQVENSLLQELTWKEEIEILGITFLKTYVYDKYVDMNFAKPLTKMSQVILSWKRFRPSLKGKVVILNTLVLPIIYYMSTMLSVPQFVYKEVDKMISSFLWNGKPARIARQTLELSAREGGLGLHNFPNRVNTAYLSWIKRLLEEEEEFWLFGLLNRHIYRDSKRDQALPP